jgi:Ser/Thr protein kinase RdoA (MazF antagonist)
MMPAVPAAATSAAVAVAARLGVTCTEPVILADGANVIVHLCPSPVVAKVAATTPEVRADVAVWLQRELDVVLFLSGAGIPVMTPSPEVPPTAHRGDGHVMTFWTYLKASGPALADEASMGSMLRDLHAALRSYPGSMPVLSPLGDIPAFLARPRTALSDADASGIAGAYTRLTAELAQTSYSAQVLHGDAGRGNLMPADGGWVWHDFEDTCAGPVAWDLAASTASPRLDGARVLAAYRDEVDPAQLRICEQLRLLNLTVWYCLYAERQPECRQRAAELVALWRLTPG